MAEEAAPKVVDPNTVVAAAAAAAVDMDVENIEAGDNGAEPNQKRAREEEEPQGGDDDVSKKQRVDEENEKSVEEQRLEKRDEQEEEKGEEKEAEKEEEEEKEASGSVNLGFKSFVSSSEMFHYFYNFLHTWPQYLNVNKVSPITPFLFSSVFLIATSKVHFCHLSAKHDINWIALI